MLSPIAIPKPTRAAARFWLKSSKYSRRTSAAVVPFSFTANRFLSLPEGDYSLRHYRALLDADTWLASIGTSAAQYTLRPLHGLVHQPRDVLGGEFCHPLYQRRQRHDFAEEDVGQSASRSGSGDRGDFVLMTVVTALVVILRGRRPQSEAQG
ncbi:hypothetical protein [Ensifer sp. LC163]|uniref:hypothetical protein n=1 Tax=Ensifer sp. LC163 TaxID=1120652 RepID=UPI000812DD99|nr:hypothetical protein [Ensifer sp. LC163]OCP37656.1 hypothetical protein BC360_21480 [Ensifer sp. LC163]